MKTTTARQRATKNYMSKMKQLLFTVTPEFYQEFTESAEKLGLSKKEFLQRLLELGKK